jgi:hypothetical protein
MEFIAGIEADVFYAMPGLQHQYLVKVCGVDEQTTGALPFCISG